MRSSDRGSTIGSRIGLSKVHVPAESIIQQQILILYYIVIPTKSTCIIRIPAGTYTTRVSIIHPDIRSTSR